MSRLTKQRPGRPVWTDEEEAEARRLKAEGKMPAEIAEILDKPKNSVESKLRSHRAKLPRVAYVTSRPPEEAVALRDRLKEARDRQNPIAAMLGEPPPGRRELVEAFMARQRAPQVEDEEQDA